MNAARAGGIVVRRFADGLRYLLVQAKNKPDEWVFPKGHVNLGEAPDEAVLREVQEEAGVAGKILEPIRELQYRDEDQPTAVAFYVVEYIGDAEAQEQRDIRWASYDEALSLLSFEESRALLADAKRLVQKYYTG
ncbi:MAG: NUDIX domain-containing protein [Acidiferrobacterales bacterium]